MGQCIPNVTILGTATTSIANITIIVTPANTNWTWIRHYDHDGSGRNPQLCRRFCKPTWPSFLTFLS